MKSGRPVSKTFRILVVIGLFILGLLFVVQNFNNVNSDAINHPVSNAIESGNIDSLKKNRFINEVTEVDQSLYQLRAEKLGIIFNIPKNGTVGLSTNEKFAVYSSSPYLEFGIKNGGSLMLSLFSSSKSVREVAQADALTYTNNDVLSKNGERALLLADLMEFNLDSHRGYKFAVHTVNSAKLSNNEFRNNYYYYLPGKNGSILKISEQYTNYDYEVLPDNINLFTELIFSIKFID